MNLERIMYTQREFKSLVSELNDFFDDFFKFYYENRPKSASSYERESLSLKLMPLLINGISYENAKKMLSIQLNLPTSYISEKLDGYYCNYLYKIRPHKIYACHKLHDAGVKNIDIAKLLNLSPATIKKYLLIPSNLE